VKVISRTILITRVRTPKNVEVSVSYQMNAYTHTPDEQAAISGDLHRNIQEQFNAAVVEIMSPNHHPVRDGNTITVPEGQRPAGHRAPAFWVDTRAR